MIGKLPLGVKALNTHPVKSHKNDPGLRSAPFPSHNGKGIERGLIACQVLGGAGGG